MKGDYHTRRTDLLGFVNGIPLLFVELKATHKILKAAYDDNLTDYRTVIPQLFTYNGALMLSNGSQTVVGSTFSPGSICSNGSGSTMRVRRALSP